MVETKIPAVAITVTLVTIMIASVLIPVLTDATTVNETLVNEGYFNLSLIDENTDITMSWDHTDPTVVTVNNVDVDMSSVPRAIPLSILGTDTVILRYEYLANGNVALYCNGVTGQLVANSTGSNDLSLTLSEGSFSITVGSTTKTASITNGFYLDPEGTYVMKDRDSPAYIQDDTIIIAGLSVVIAPTTAGVFGIGNIDDGMALNNIVSYQTNYEIGTATINATDTKWVDTYLLESITFDITDTDTDTVVPITYTYFAVPEEMTAERIVHFTDGENAILLTIPTLTIIALLIGVVAIFMRSKY